MIEFKNYRGDPSGWRRHENRKSLSFSRSRQRLDKFEGTHLSMRRTSCTSVYGARRNFMDSDYWWGYMTIPGSIYEQFLLSCAGLTIDEAYSRYSKLLKKHNTIIVRGGNKKEFFYEDFEKDNFFYVDKNDKVDYMETNEDRGYKRQYSSILSSLRFICSKDIISYNQSHPNEAYVIRLDTRKLTKKPVKIYELRGSVSWKKRRYLRKLYVHAYIPGKGWGDLKESHGFYYTAKLYTSFYLIRKDER
jgi:hypothetical protein